MINTNTLNKLLSDNIIKQIINLCEDIVLSDIRLFVTHEFEDREKIHFIGKQEQPVSLYLMRHTAKQIQVLLDCEVVVAAEDMLNELVKEEVLDNTVCYTLDNKEEIKNYFNENILPFAQMSEQEFFKMEDSENEMLQSDAPHQILVVLKNIPELWKQIEENPGILQEAVNILQSKMQEMKIEV